ncbi:uncharacterized protein LOC126986080 isoform X5 [Eriocheir sinensis]|uniref:uncharacterized protein LOC126986080 isoform X5 n=1 Tax=Eriocheir sinensis TaxID=95602 RepID=UPI0021C85645|nr:uncharacterized protein LOC126986080 isoform X5 [Eriocheir sinensis]
MSPAFSASAASTPEAAPQPRQTPTPTASSPPILDVTPEAVQPYPKAPPRPAARGRKKIRACILTEDEEALGQLREKEEKKAAREEKKRRSEEKKREKKREQEARQAAKRRRRSEPVEASSSDEEAADNPALCDDSSEYSDEFAEELEHDAASYPFVQKEPEMPRSCCVPGCKSNYSTADASGFRFPEDEQRRVQWIRAIRREDFKPTTNTVVCAKHFEQHCILTKDSVTRPDGTVITAMRGRPSLTKDACPTIFENQPNDCSEDALSQCDEIAIKKEEEDVCIKEEPIEDLDVITGCGTFVPVLKSKPRSNSDHSEDALSQCDEIGIKEEEEDVCTKEDPIEDFDPVTGYTIFVPTLKSKLRSDRAQRACAEHKRRPRKTDGGVPAPATPEGTEKGLSITSSGGNDLGSHHDSRANTSMDSPTHQGSPQPKKKRKPNWSNDETLRLVNLMAEKHLTVNGRFRPSLTRADKKRAWADVTNAINASNVSVRRTEEEVINKWFTVLSHSRKKISTVRKEFNQSGGGGPQAPPLDPVDLKVEEIFGEKNATVDGNLPLNANEISLKKLHATEVTLQEQQIDVGHQEQQQQQIDEHLQHQPEQLSETSNNEIYFDSVDPCKPNSVPPEIYVGDQYINKYNVSESAKEHSKETGQWLLQDKLETDCAASKQAYKREKRRLRLLQMKEKIKFKRLEKKAKIDYWRAKADYYKSRTKDEEQ